MAQRKRNSSALSKAERRNEALLSFNPSLDLGNSLSVEQLFPYINDVREKLAAYNVARATVGVAQNALVEAERKLNIYSSQLLSGIAAVYGRESDEYQMTLEAFACVSPSSQRSPQTFLSIDKFIS